MARRMEEQKNRAFRSAPRRPRPRARVPTLEQMNDQLRNDQPNKTESGPGPASRTQGSSEQQYQRSPRGSAQGTGTGSRVPATHVGAAITDAASSSTVGVCSDGSPSTAHENATSSNGVDIRGDAAKDLARVVRDGSTPEGQRLREQLWVWLHLQDEEATEPVPKQLQSWLTGHKKKTAKGTQEKQATSFFANGLDRDLLSTTYHSSRSQTRTSHDDPDHLTGTRPR